MTSSMSVSKSGKAMWVSMFENQEILDNYWGSYDTGKSYYGIPVYHFPRFLQDSISKNRLERPLKDWEFELAKRVVIFGRVKAGKSTLINALANIALDVEHELKIRYEIIEGEAEFKKGPYNSTTPQIRSYGIKIFEGDLPLLIVDTPGLPDDVSINDKNYIDQLIHNLFKNQVDRVNLIVIVVPNWAKDFTPAENYLIFRLKQIFGPHIISNILVLFTSVSRKYVLKQNFQIPQGKTEFGSLAAVIKDWYLTCDSEIVFRSNDPRNTGEKMDWDIFQKFAENFVQKILLAPTVSILLGPEQLLSRQKLAQIINNTYHIYLQTTSLLLSAQEAIKMLKKNNFFCKFLT